LSTFTPGSGPPRSHSVGPRRPAALVPRGRLADGRLGPRVAAVAVHLYGSLAATAEGHGTLDAVVMGLEGADPENVDPVAGRDRVRRMEAEGVLRMDGSLEVRLRPSLIERNPLTFFLRQSK